MISVHDQHKVYLEAIKTMPVEIFAKEILNLPKKLLKDKKAMSIAADMQQFEIDRINQKIKGGTQSTKSPKSL